MNYRFYGWENADVPASSEKYIKISDPKMMYDILDQIWCEYTCAPRMRMLWADDNKTLGQCSITAFLAQDVFGGKVYGILRSGGNYHCYNDVGGCVFDLTSEQFGDEVLSYENNPEQFREVHFAKEEKKERYEYLKNEFDRKLSEIRCTAVTIYDDDYGCEGVPEDSEPMCRVLIRYENGAERWVKLSDRYLRENGIDEGSVF
ncbi:MAG: hypothetical protein MJ095_03330 [Oscillospiraceae bacterium]|nr:hypothetical protein [Oscillospiraceae bacterium]